MTNSKNILAAQLAFSPEVRNAHPFNFGSVVVGGMGGSGLAARALSWLGVSRHIITHRDYDLPERTPEHALYIAVSHSGNTEETLSFAAAVRERALALAIVASGGKLIEFAKENGVPFIKVPADFIPRDSVFYHLRAIAAFTGEEAPLAANDIPDSAALRAEAEQTTAVLHGRVPLVYASTRNEPLAYIWKTTLNETAKVPAFSNVFPEFNHNELQGIDPKGPLGERVPFVPLILEDSEDDARVTHRMYAFNESVARRGIAPHVVPGATGARGARLMWHWVLAREVAHMLAEKYGVRPDETPFIEEFKRQL